MRGADAELIQQATLEDGEVIVRDGFGRVMEAEFAGAESLQLEVMEIRNAPELRQPSRTATG